MDDQRVVLAAPVLTLLEIAERRCREESSRSRRWLGRQGVAFASDGPPNQDDR
jgi:hypothetical protein